MVKNLPINSATKARNLRANIWLDKTCADYKIEHRLTKPYTPKTNGMVERVNNKVVANVLDRIQFKTIEQLKRSMFHYSYNHQIKHSGIDRKTPIQAFGRGLQKKG